LILVLEIKYTIFAEAAIGRSMRKNENDIKLVLHQHSLFLPFIFLC